MRSFSETAVCYASKDGTTKDGGSDGGKVMQPSATVELLPALEDMVVLLFLVY